MVVNSQVKDEESEEEEEEGADYGDDFEDGEESSSERDTIDMRGREIEGDDDEEEEEEDEEGQLLKSLDAAVEQRLGSPLLKSSPDRRALALPRVSPRSAAISLDLPPISAGAAWLARGGGGESPRAPTGAAWRSTLHCGPTALGTSRPRARSMRSGWTLRGAVRRRGRR